MHELRAFMLSRLLGFFGAVALTAGVIVACGGTEGGLLDGDDAADTRDASPSHDVTAPGDAPSDAAETSDATRDDAGEGAVDGGPDGAIACTIATVGDDCPPLPCQVLTGCTNGVCQYAVTAVCVVRSFSGTFVTGEFRATVGDTVVTGQIGPFLQEQGPRCVGGTCVTGDLLP